MESLRDIFHWISNGTLIDVGKKPSCCGLPLNRSHEDTGLISFAKRAWPRMAKVRRARLAIEVAKPLRVDKFREGLFLVQALG